MYIHEAIQATTLQKPCIARESWFRFSSKPTGGVTIQPTDSPDGCIVESDVLEGVRRIWQPTAADLVADDWKTVRL